MKDTSRLGRRAAPAAVAAACLALAGASLASPARASADLAGAGGFEAAPLPSTTILRVGLTPMPQGQFVADRGQVSLAEYGLTPGSRHEVALSLLGFRVPVGTLTASAGGSVRWNCSLARLEKAAARFPGRRASVAMPGVSLVILNAGHGTPVIARTPAINWPGRYPVRAVEPGRGVIRPGGATLAYDPATRVLSVTVSAAGLTPGAHAAHIHAGSCQRQGGVVYTLRDFTANSRGVIRDETRTVTGVTAVKLSGGWYLNLHQGDSGTIVRNGRPTISFRPLECANL